MLSDYQIAEISCGPGRIGLAPIPGRTGAYETDLATLLRWDAGLVLTMTTEPELERAGASGLAADLAAAGVVWRHLPVPDFGAPPPSVDAVWPSVSGEAHALLSREGRVFVHCFGGCRRSGMVVLRLLVETGEDVESALARLRIARPCAVETEGQRAWAARPIHPGDRGDA